jgi:hypothetical protein
VLPEPVEVCKCESEAVDSIDFRAAESPGKRLPGLFAFRG